MVQDTAIVALRSQMSSSQTSLIAPSFLRPGRSDSTQEYSRFIRQRFLSNREGLPTVGVSTDKIYSSSVMQIQHTHDIPRNLNSSIVKRENSKTNMPNGMRTSDVKNAQKKGFATARPVEQQVRCFLSRVFARPAYSCQYH